MYVVALLCSPSSTHVCWICQAKQDATEAQEKLGLANAKAEEEKRKDEIRKAQDIRSKALYESKTQKEKEEEDNRLKAEAMQEEQRTAKSAEILARQRKEKDAKDAKEADIQVAEEAAKKKVLEDKTAQAAASAKAFRVNDTNIRM